MGCETRRSGSLHERVRRHVDDIAHRRFTECRQGKRWLAICLSSVFLSAMYTIYYAGLTDAVVQAAIGRSGKGLGRAALGRSALVWSGGPGGEKVSLDCVASRVIDIYQSLLGGSGR